MSALVSNFIHYISQMSLPSDKPRLSAPNKCGTIKITWDERTGIVPTPVVNRPELDRIILTMHDPDTPYLDPDNPYGQGGTLNKNPNCKIYAKFEIYPAYMSEFKIFECPTSFTFFAEPKFLTGSSIETFKVDLDFDDTSLKPQPSGGGEQIVNKTIGIVQMGDGTKVTTYGVISNNKEMTKQEYCNIIAVQEPSQYLYINPIRTLYDNTNLDLD